MKLQTIADVERALVPFYKVAGETTGKDITVARMERLMAHLGNPERELRVIHIAGTSGKTSTTYYISALLAASGARVGTTVSPHVDSLAERVQLDGQPLAEQVFVAYMEEYLAIITTAPEAPSWFEAMLGFALWVFAREHVDYAVVETGLGGLHDASNICKNPDKVCVITDIGLDHQHVLGDTIGQIAAQKAGIIYPGNTVFMYEQDEGVMRPVHEAVQGAPGATIHIQSQNELAATWAGLSLDDLPLFQQRNWLLAAGAVRYIAARDQLPDIPGERLRETLQVQVPGRMENVIAGNKMVIMDGAHNAAKTQAFTESFVAAYPDKRVPVLLAIKNNKDVAGIIPYLQRIASEVILTTFEVAQDYWRIKSADPAHVETALREAGIANIRTIADPFEAYRALLAVRSDVVVVTGSFYLLSQLRKRKME